MAVDKLVDSTQLDADLTSVANAIRSKGGTSAPLAFPSGFVSAVQAIPGGGGGGATLIEKNISANGTYNASSDSADGYSKVVVSVPASAVDSGTKSINSNGTHDVTGYATASVSVPNSYSAGDEGKVVSNGALVAQSSDSVTTNGIYDTTLINSLAVNVSGGGGASLPSIISKIDGGSFTPASDTATRSYPISHNLGTAPKGVAIWATNMTKEVYGVRTVNMLQMTSTEYDLLQVNTNGTDRVLGGPLTSGDLGSSSFIFTLSSNSYKAGVTYQWLAWA